MVFGDSKISDRFSIGKFFIVIIFVFDGFCRSNPNAIAPFRLRWIAPSQATFKQPMVAGESDVFFNSLEGTVSAYEQSTGRLRWRRRLDGPGWCRHGLLYSDGLLFVPRPGGAAKTGPRAVDHPVVAALPPQPA